MRVNLAVGEAVLLDTLVGLAILAESVMFYVYVVSLILSTLMQRLIQKTWKWIGKKRRWGQVLSGHGNHTGWLVVRHVDWFCFCVDRVTEGCFKCRSG